MSTMTETDVAEFRKKCVDFMDTYAVKSGNAMPSFEDQKAYLAAAAGAGLAGVPFAEEFGGGGLTLEHEKVWRRFRRRIAAVEVRTRWR